MKSARLFSAATCLVTLFAILSFAADAPKPPTPEATAFFETKVRPLLFEKCFACHGDKLQQSGLRLDSRSAMLKGGKRGPAIVPGDPENSLLIKAIRHGGELKMPPTGKLKDDDIATLTEWVKMGAPYPDSNLKSQIPNPKSYWAFQPLKNPPIPKVKNKWWVKTPIDAFILAELERRGMKPNPYADRRTLMRRAYFDLIGLPPTPEEVEAFVNDKSPNAWEKVIDRLLDSPHYGERWGRHWLDLARFAESHGYEQDYDRPNAYHYRDFVIKASNMDLPYDQFVKWQIAGDEFEPDNPLALMATGFLAAGTHATQITKNQVEKERYDELDDKLSTIGTTFLGLTIGCARCHNHKYDPIPQSDYYRMVSTFTKTVRSDYEINLDPEGFKTAKARFDAEHAPLVDALQKFEQEQLPQRFEEWLKKPRSAEQKRPEQVERVLAKSPEEWTSDERVAVLKWFASTDPQWQALNKPVQDHLKNEPKLPRVLICSEGVPAVRTHTQGGDYLEYTHFLKRGDPNNKGEIVTQSFLTVLMRAPEGEKRWQEQPPQGWRTPYLRRSLANWITDVDYGAGHLLARVIVNRLWQHHIGRGIVATPSDFGKQGERPTHPELLDWLAVTFVENGKWKMENGNDSTHPFSILHSPFSNGCGWSLKKMHKLMLMSATYQQSSLIPYPLSLIKDPDNKLCWRHPRQRLEAEVIRDAMLSVSGLLDNTMFGPGTLDETMKRRSIYFFVKRSKLIPTMILFDAPNALGAISARPTTTIAPQALLLLNNQNIREYARAFAKRVAKPDAPREEAVKSAYLLALNRPPLPQELTDTLAFLEQQTASYKAAGRANAEEMALTDFCQVLVSLNEFVYVE